MQLATVVIHGICVSIVQRGRIRGYLVCDEKAANALTMQQNHEHMSVHTCMHACAHVCVCVCVCVCVRVWCACTHTQAHMTKEKG